MLSNQIHFSVEELTPDSCFQMADFFDAQAAFLRRAGEQKKRDNHWAKQADKTDLEKHKKLLLAGSEALELVENNVEKSAACSRIATVFGLDYLHVEANFEYAKREKIKRIRNQRIEKARILSRNGLSVRQIADKLEVSKSTVQAILKPAERAARRP